MAVVSFHFDTYETQYTVHPSLIDAILKDFNNHLQGKPTDLAIYRDNEDTTFMVNYGLVRLVEVKS